MNAHETSVAVSFALFVLLFVGVGIYSGSQQKETVDDYLLASREANPWLTGISTVATSNSGFMFIGLIGFTYYVGVGTVWLILGWILGDFLAWTFIHRRFRRVSEGVQATTIASFLGQEQKDATPWITVVVALTTIAFLGVYAASQLQAGSKALSVIFGWDNNLGILFGAVIVTIYCFAGGIRASIWVGSLQSGLMILSMLTLVTISVLAIGGPGALWSALRGINPALLSLAPPNLQFGLLPFALSWLLAGFGVIGQPHIMRRIMAIDSFENVIKARNVYTLLYIIFALSALGVGLTSRVLLPELINGGDTETALPQLSETLLPGIGVGVTLAGLFAATISTADALLLTCSAAVSQDIFPRASRSFFWVRTGTLGVSVLILGIAWVSSDNVFVLATLAWTCLASGLGPLMIARVLQLPMTPVLGLSMIVAGLGTALVWRFGLGLSDSICEALPGMVASTLIYGVERGIFQIQRSLQSPKS